MKILLLATLLVIGCSSKYESSSETEFGSKIKSAKTLDDLRLLRNEIFARYGRVFTDSSLQSYFAQKSWYKINPEYNDSVLSATDKRLISDIQKKEKELETDKDKIKKLEAKLHEVKTNKEYLMLLTVCKLVDQRLAVPD